MDLRPWSRENVTQAMVMEAAVSRKAPPVGLWPKRRYRGGYLGLSDASGGNELGWVKKVSAACLPVRNADAIRSTALPALGGITTVAVSEPLRTASCPDFGRPSDPIKGSFNQRSRKELSFMSSKALRAPSAIASFWAATTPMAISFAIASFSQEV